MKSSIGLLGDFCQSYNGDMKHVININIVEIMITKLKEIKLARVVKVLAWSQAVIILFIVGHKTSNEVKND